MRKQTMVQATFIMVIVGLITKILGVINRILITRNLGETGIGVYMLLSPTVMLLATISTIGLPVAIPTLVSRGEIKESKILYISLALSLTISTIITMAMLVLANPIATNLLRDERTALPLMMIGPLMCVVSYTSILKSYFQGKEQMTPAAISTLLEQVVRILLSVIFIGWFLPRGIAHAVAGLMLASIGGELVSAVILTTTFLKFKKKKYPDAHFRLPKLEPVNFKDILGISLPTTGSRFVGTITHFLEPIIVAKMLFYLGFSSDASTNMYGAVAGFAIPLLFMPSFISGALTSALIPAISKAYKNRDFKTIHKRLSTSIKIANFTCGFYLIIVMIFPGEIMNLLYNSTTGAEYLKIMAPFFLLLYLQAPLVATLQAIGEARFALKASVISSIIKIFVMFFLLRIESLNILGLVYAIIINIVILTVWYYKITAKKLNYSLSKLKVVNGVLVMAALYLIGYYLRDFVTVEMELLRILIISGVLLILHTILSAFSGLFPK